MHPVEAVLKRRTSGRVSCAIVARDPALSPTAAADRAVQGVGLRPLGDGWLEISDTDAEVIATGVLHRDLAYGAEIMPLAQAAELASDLFALVPLPMTCFTNGEWADALGDADDAGEALESVGFDPISDATLDAGVVCVGEEVTLLLWVEDED
ncbi:MAG: hypothetical protein U0164_06650 [Gemmatimonadaceae bacterium]